jgi:hypothetical protein
VAEAAAPYISRLAERFGARFQLQAEPNRLRDAFEVAAR